MARQKGCVWCGKGPLTNEDALPQRMVKWLYNGNKTALLGSLHRTGQDPPKIRPVRRVKTQVMLAKRVCQPCNGGWMAGLDDAAGPYVKLMMSGFSIVLNADAKLKIASWATKTSMMLIYASEEMPPIHMDHLQWMYNKKSPMDGAQVWLSGYVGRLDGLADVKHLTFQDSDVRVDANTVNGPYSGYLVSIVLGMLLVQVWIWSDPLHAALPIPFHNVRANFAQRIWPSGIIDLSWPPQNVAGDRVFHDLTMTSPEMIEVCFRVTPPI